MLRLITSLFRSSNVQPTLGRWATIDNADIKSALANIDSCGDRLCGDPYTSKKAIDMYTNVKICNDSAADNSKSLIVKDKQN